MVFRTLGVAVAGLCAMGAASPASAYLFWFQPNFAGASAVGDEPGLVYPMQKATKAELQANMLWSLRAGLNVAALQCQFSPILMTVPNYNDLLSKNGAELKDAYAVLNAYFKRTGGKTWATQMDQYTTKVYNGYSTMHAQLGFCETASSIGRAARAMGRGKLTQLAADRIREFRNSLIPTGDLLNSRRSIYIPVTVPSMSDDCWNKNGSLKARCSVGQYQATAAEPAQKS